MGPVDKKISNNKDSFTNKERKQIIAARYKKSYGTKQSGTGQGLIQKQYFKKKFQKQKERFQMKQERRKQFGNNEGINENKKNVIKEDELKFLPVIARLDDDFAEENVTQDLEKKKKLSKLSKAKLEYKKVQEEKKKKRLERERIKKEKEEKFKAKKEEALRRNKKFSQKTKKGQPMMGARMELLLDAMNKKMGPS